MHMLVAIVWGGR